MGTALYLGQGRELYLTDTFAGDVETFSDFFEGLGLAAGEAARRNPNRPEGEGDETSETEDRK